MNTSLTTALEEGISAIYGAIGVCGDIGNLRHALNLMQIELKRLKKSAVIDEWPHTGEGMHD